MLQAVLYEYGRTIRRHIGPSKMVACFPRFVALLLLYKCTSTVVVLVGEDRFAVGCSWLPVPGAWYMQQLKKNGCLYR